MQYITLEDIKNFTQDLHNRGFKTKPILCEDCERELTKREESFCGANYQGMYCFNCQKNHSTIKTNRAYKNAKGDLVFQPKFYKCKTINKGK